MAASAYWVRWDTYPPLQLTLSDVNGAINLTTASTVKAIWQSTTAQPQVLGTGLMTIASAAGGFCTYNWGASDLAIADTYNLQAEVLWSTGSQVESFPNSAYASFVVFPDLENK